MGRNRIERISRDRLQADRSCWREILQDALSGFSDTDQQLEKLFDHLERAR